MSSSFVRLVRFVGAWRSLVARLLWEQEVLGSNPGAPTIFPTFYIKRSDNVFKVKLLDS